MTKVEQLERALERVSPEERASLRAWHSALDAAEWDPPLEAVVAAGRLDLLADAALAEHGAGRTRQL